MSKILQNTLCALVAGAALLLSGCGSDKQAQQVVSPNAEQAQGVSGSEALSLQPPPTPVESIKTIPSLVPYETNGSSRYVPDWEPVPAIPGLERSIQYWTLISASPETTVVYSTRDTRQFIVAVDFSDNPLVRDMGRSEQSRAINLENLTKQVQKELNGYLGFTRLKDKSWRLSKARKKVLPELMHGQIIPYDVLMQKLGKVKDPKKAANAGENPLGKGKTYAKLDYFVYKKGIAEELAPAIEEFTRWQPWLELEFRKKGLSPWLSALSVVESRHDNHAVSSAAAVGPYQIIPSTARSYPRGNHLLVNRNGGIDERKDPLRAAQAAADILAEVREVFMRNGLRFEAYQDQVATSGYNAGAGNVRKAIRSVKKQPGNKKMADIDAFVCLITNHAKYGAFRGDSKDYPPQVYPVWDITHSTDGLRQPVFEFDYAHIQIRDGEQLPLSLMLSQISSIVNPDEFYGRNPHLTESVYFDRNTKRVGFYLPKGTIPRVRAELMNLPGVEDVSGTVYRYTIPARNN